MNLFQVSILAILERLSFHTLRTILILYCINVLKLGDKESYCIFSRFMIINYITPVIGGVISDRLLGYYKSLVFGSFFMFLGTSICLIKQYDIILGISLFSLGAGISKTNIVTLLSSIKNNKNNKNFSLYFLIQNLGALLAALLCFYIEKYHELNYCFLVLVTLLFFFFAYSIYMYNRSSGRDFFRKKVFIGTVICVISLATIFLILKNHLDINNVVIISLFYVLYILASHMMKNNSERRNIILILILMLFNSIFWFFVEQIGSTINVFFDKLTKLDTIEGSIPATFYQIFNPLSVILLIPAISYLYKILNKRKIMVPNYTKFGTGLIVAGISFIILKRGVQNFNINLNFIIFFNIILGIGEVLVAPVGMSILTNLAPLKIKSTIIGFWQCTVAFSNWAIGILAVKYLSNGEASNELLIFNSYFTSLSLIGIISGILFMIIFKNFKSSTNQ